MKKRYPLEAIVVLLAQIAILILTYFLVWGDNIFLLGITAMIMQWVLHLKFVGWVGAIAYTVTYWCAGLLDTPQEGNLYVYWYFSYLAITIFALIADLILKNRKGKS